MNRQTYESAKTAGFVIVATAIVVIVYLTMPALPSLQPEEMLGKLLFPDFDDPLAAISLEIVEFDKETATARPSLSRMSFEPTSLGCPVLAAVQTWQSGETVGSRE